MLTRSTRILFPCVCIVFAFALLSFGSSSKVSATEDVDYNVSIAPSLKLTIPSNPIIINLDPSSKTFDSKDFSVVVATNNRTGYTLTLSTPNDNTNLNRDTASDGVSAIMPTLDPGTYTQSSFTADKWGYKINSNTSIPSTVTSGYVPFVSGNTLMESDTAVNHDEAELSLAAKIDYLQPSGSYSTTLNFNLVAHPQVNYMQDLNPSLCTSTPTTVIDKRDGQEYVVQRLTDGNCWMMENLNLGAVELTKDLTSENTNLATAVTAATFNGWKVDAHSSTFTAGEFVPISGVDPTAQTKYGTLYNYCALSANTICSSTNASDATYDLCPAGWRLPTGGSNGEYQNLYSQTAYNTLAKMRAPISSGGAAFAFAGSGTSNVGNDGFWWTSTRNNDTRMYGMWIQSSVNSGYYGTRYYTRSARCVLKQTMQTFSSAATNAMATGATLSLEDERDGQIYTVRKLADGNVWMTKDLAIGCNGTAASYGGSRIARTLTSADTNISSTWDTSTATNLSTLGDSLVTPGMQCDSTRGAWYNYAAVTAGTITGASNNTNATEDICPKGWRLPTGPEQSNLATLIGSSPSSYAPVTKPIYSNKTTAGYADWWSSTASDTTKRYTIYYYNNASLVYYSNDGRHFGFYVRCVAK